MRARSFLLALWTAAVLVLGSNAGLPLLVVMLIIYGGGAILIAWLIVVCIALFRRSLLRSWWLEPATVVLVLLALAVHAPFRVRFEMSRPALDRYVRDARRTGTATPNVRAGLFTIQEAEVLPDGVVRLITTDCMLDDCGVTFVAYGDPPTVGEDSYEHLEGSWWLWMRSW